jgi:hypothetical protein
MLNTELLKAKFDDLRPLLDERQIRLLAAVEARVLGHGGIKAVALASGLSRRTIERAADELRSDRPPCPDGRTRRAGGGRKPLPLTDPGLCAALENLVAPATRGDPMSPLRWTSKSTAKLAAQLTAAGHPVSARSVAALLKSQDYSLQSVRKKLEGAGHEHRDAQFEQINDSVKAFQAAGQPVISIDAKKKELIGAFHNKGREWQPAGQPVPANTHDFMDKELGKVTPYGVFDMSANEGWVSVGIDHDTAQFAVETIRRWWLEMGQARYPEASRLLITADGGASNGVRLRLWKTSLQRLASELGLELHVCHFPPGTSKWNKIEHRMFAQITHNWRGRCLTSRQVVVELIGATSTQSGRRLRAALDENSYPTKQQVTDEELAAVKIIRKEFHGEWNYAIHP